MSQGKVNPEHHEVKRSSKEFDRHEVKWELSRLALLKGESAVMEPCVKYGVYAA